jgi:hypothetical protein
MDDTISHETIIPPTCKKSVRGLGGTPLTEYIVLPFFYLEIAFGDRKELSKATGGHHH